MRGGWMLGWRMLPKGRPVSWIPGGWTMRFPLIAATTLSTRWSVRGRRHSTTRLNLIIGKFGIMQFPKNSIAVIEISKVPMTSQSSEKSGSNINMRGSRVQLVILCPSYWSEFQPIRRAYFRFNPFRNSFLKVDRTRCIFVWKYYFISLIWRKKQFFHQER